MDGLTFTPDEEIARRSDIYGVNQRMDGLNQRMDGLEQRMDGLEQRMGGLEQRMDSLERSLVDTEQRLLVNLHKEMITQTRFFAVTMGAVVVSTMAFVAAVL